MTRKHSTIASSKQSRLASQPAVRPAFELVLERLIDSPRERVFAAWTKPEAVSQWFAPKPFKLNVYKMDFRPGGRFRMAMRGPDGHDFPFTGRYREIVPSGMLSWSGEFPSGPADQISTVVTFTELGRKTKVHVRQTFHVMTPEIKHAAKGARAGWTMTLQQLAEYCTRAQDRIEQRIELKSPIAQVWRALTEHEQFGEWFRVKLEGPFILGQAACGEITSPGFEHIKWEAVVRKMEPERLFSFTWHPYAVDAQADYSQEKPTLVEFRLKATANGTTLSLSETGFDHIASARRLEAFRMHEEGWTQQLKNIAEHLAQRPQEELGRKIMPCLWFDDCAEDAAKFYVSVFKDSKILAVSRYGKSAAKAAGQPQGSVMTVSFRIEGQQFLALNGGPQFVFTPAISLIVNCRSQAEIDALWGKLSAQPEAEACGWLKDRFGVSWQIVPAALGRMVQDQDPGRAERVAAALLKMKKLDQRALQAAAGRTGSL
jgi:predicted 3-demethylubiquinone-9 3-methyltransferase (glyoxalase superfamily)/uncharacterized protein YndB with AHSA1/START domain